MRDCEADGRAQCDDSECEQRAEEAARGTDRAHRACFARGRGRARTCSGSQLGVLRDFGECRIVDATGVGAPVRELVRFRFAQPHSFGVFVCALGEGRGGQRGVIGVDRFALAIGIEGRDVVEDGARRLHFGELLAPGAQIGESRA